MQNCCILTYISVALNFLLNHNKLLNAKLLYLDLQQCYTEHLSKTNKTLDQNEVVSLDTTVLHIVLSFYLKNYTAKRLYLHLLYLLGQF